MKFTNFLIKFKKLLITLGILGVASAAVVGLQPNEIQLTEVQIPLIQISERYANVFEDQTTKERIEVEITKAQYQELAVKNAIQPTYPNAKWMSSYGGQPVYDTSQLLDGQFVVVDNGGKGLGTGLVLVKVSNLKAKMIDKKFIINNILTIEGLNELNK